MVCKSGPTLLLTHEPLETMPPHCVNVHGHIQGPGPELSPDHVNVCVKRTEYEPVRLSDPVRKLRGERGR